MASYRFFRVTPIGDGSNRDFSIGVDFRPDTLSVFENGLALRGPDDDDGWTVTGARTFRMHEAPRDGAILEAFAIPVSG